MVRMSQGVFRTREGGFVVIYKKELERVYPWEGYVNSYLDRTSGMSAWAPGGWYWIHDGDDPRDIVEAILRVRMPPRVYEQLILSWLYDHETTITGDALELMVCLRIKNVKKRLDRKRAKKARRTV